MHVPDYAAGTRMSPTLTNMSRSAQRTAALTSAAPKRSIVKRAASGVRVDGYQPL